MLETFLGSNDFNTTSAIMPNNPMPHILQMRRQALQVCNFVIGHLPDNPLKREEVYRAQNTFRLRALLLRSLQEVGEWEDLVGGVKIGINATLTPPSPPAGSVRPKQVTLDDLLLQVHSIGTSICDKPGFGTPPPDSSLNLPDNAFLGSTTEREVPRSLEAPEWRVLQPTPLLFPEEALRLLLILWPSSHGTLPSIALPTIPENSRDDVWIERLKVSTNTATSRLLRTWATRVQDLLEAQLSTPGGQATPTTVPGSIFQATLSLVVLADYLAFSLSPTATSYNDLGIVLSSPDSQPTIRRPPGSGSPNGATGHSLSRVYFEAGLEVDPHNVHLLTNLGSYWKKERNYGEAIRFVWPLLQIV